MLHCVAAPHPGPTAMRSAKVCANGCHARRSAIGILRRIGMTRWIWWCSPTKDAWSS